jgi:hypothetical protein
MIDEPVSTAAPPELTPGDNVDLVDTAETGIDRIATSRSGTHPLTRSGRRRGEGAASPSPSPRGSSGAGSASLSQGCTCPTATSRPGLLDDTTRLLAAVSRPTTRAATMTTYTKTTPIPIVGGTGDLGLG